MFCNKCGLPIQENETKCPNCGTEVNKNELTTELSETTGSAKKEKRRSEKKESVFLQELLLVLWRYFCLY